MLCALALGAAISTRWPTPGSSRLAAPRMTSIDGYWQMRSQREVERTASFQRDLDEFLERERIYIGHVKALQAEINELRMLGAATAPAAPDQPAAPLPMAAAPGEAVVAAEELHALDSQIQADIEEWGSKLKRSLAEAEKARDALGEQLEAAKLAREVDVQRTSAFWLERLSRQSAEHTEGATAAAAAEATGLREQLDATQRALAAAQAARELDVQKVAAFWVAKLAEEREAADKATAFWMAAAEREAASAASAASAPDPESIKAEAAAAAAAAAATPVAAAAVGAADESREQRLQSLVHSLEAELAGLEEDYEDLSERMEVQSETIQIASGRLEELADAFEAQALQAERQLQSSAAFWVAKLSRERAEHAAALGASQAAASAQRSLADDRLRQLSAPARTPAAPVAAASPSDTPTSAVPSAGDRVRELEAFLELQSELVALQEVQLEEAARQRELDLQAVAAFWVTKTGGLREELTEARARASALRQALSARELRAEKELQATAAFWLQRVASLRENA